MFSVESNRFGHTETFKSPTSAKTFQTLQNLCQGTPKLSNCCFDVSSVTTPGQNGISSVVSG